MTVGRRLPTAVHGACQEAWPWHCCCCPGWHWAPAAWREQSPERRRKPRAQRARPPVSAATMTTRMSSASSAAPGTSRACLTESRAAPKLCGWTATTSRPSPRRPSRTSPAWASSTCRAASWAAWSHRRCWA
ncbi:IGFALS isoform 3 [Pongo abelii]|uniref:IGFALS isoform 3 n=1 Tax=Pongo abelii TaxID=9601 RepID=A0A2J8R9B2_PONAB|nr:IGFALS isoform 3 [Pongo abelii]